MLYVWVDYKDGKGFGPHMSFEDNEREEADFEIQELKEGSEEYEAKYGKEFPKPTLKSGLKSDKEDAFKTITVTQEITIKRVADLLCSALEGGTGYWACVGTVNKGKSDVKPWGDEYTPEYIQAPFCTDGYLEIEDLENNDTKYKLNRATLKRGLKIMSNKYPSHMADFISECDDAVTGDVFLQCCLLGDCIYG